MKRNLIILSLSPLFFLTILQYCPWNKLFKQPLNWEIIKEHLPLCIGEGVCIIWVICSAVIFFEFIWFQKYDTVGGYEVKNVVEEKDAGLNFFLTLILPLLVNDITSWNGLIVMLCLVVIIVCLLSKTNLYYQNPVLVILKYKVYRFDFIDNERLKSQRYIGLTRENLEEGNFITYKQIEDNILIVRRRNS